MTTLKEAIKSLKIFERLGQTSRRRVSEELLGKYSGIIPKSKSSTKMIKDYRNKLYGKERRDDKNEAEN
jgi:isopenicillin N synthase-like dioxygenase